MAEALQHGLEHGGNGLAVGHAGLNGEGVHTQGLTGGHGLLGGGGIAGVVDGHIGAQTGQFQADGPADAAAAAGDEGGLSGEIHGIILLSGRRWPLPDL